MERHKTCAMLLECFLRDHHTLHHTMTCRTVHSCEHELRINKHFAARWIDFPSNLHIRFCVPLLQLCIHQQRNKTTWQYCLLPLIDTTELAPDQKLRFKKMKLFKDHFFLTKHGFCFIPDSTSNKGLSHACIDRQGDQILLVSLSFCWFSSLPSALPYPKLQILKLHHTWFSSSCSSSSSSSSSWTTWWRHYQKW